MVAPARAAAYFVHLHTPSRCRRTGNRGRSINSAARVRKMSEYQYYEFQAVDRALSKEEMSRLRAISSRATITPNSFVNTYNYGDFRGNAWTLMEHYFDAFLYFANWGTREVMLRVPRRMLDITAVQGYFDNEFARAEERGDHVILAFRSEDEDRDGDWDEDGSGRLATLISLRGELAAGDHRALYLGWLLAVQLGEQEDDLPEPPVPPGLGQLTGAQAAFADFLRIDEDLINAAAERSAAPVPEPDAAALRAWIAALPAAEKDEMLVRVAAGDANRVRLELASGCALSAQHEEAAPPEPRTASELLARADELCDERRRAAAERAAREKARREQEKAVARDRYLNDLQGRDEELWTKVGELVALKRAGAYDEAVTLLCDLRDLAIRDRRANEAEARLLAFREEHAGKPALLRRMDAAGLRATASRVAR
jgi:hypothetical protein